MPVAKKKGYQPKVRNSGTRKRKSVLLLETEGNNKTETLYFRNFSSGTFTVRFAHGNDTDPSRMAQQLVAAYEKMELDPELGDLAFCLVDADFIAGKEQQIKEADKTLTKKIHAEVIVSNPCFEVWFIYHFTYSTRQYLSNDDVIGTLRCYIPNYRKERVDMFELLCDKTETAMVNAKQLQSNCLKQGYPIHECRVSPYTEVYKIVEAVNKK